MSWESNDTNITPQILWMQATFRLEDLIHRIKVTTWTGEAFRVLEIQNKKVILLKFMQIKVQRSAPDGQCYTLKFEGSLLKLQIRQVIIGWLVCYLRAFASHKPTLIHCSYRYMPGIIVVSTPNMFLNPNQRRKYVVVNNGNFLFIDYIETKYMPTVDTSQGPDKMPCNKEANWDDNCFYKNAGEKVGASSCTTPW